MDILHLIDRLEEMTGEARRWPLGGGVVMSRERLLDLVDRMRVAMPAELYEAREVLERREEVLREAHQEAAQMVARAQAEVEERLKETEVVRAAEERAGEILRQAQERAQELLRQAEEQARDRLDDAQEMARHQMREADVYALQTLKRLKQELEGFLATVQRGIETLEQRAAERPG